MWCRFQQTVWFYRGEDNGGDLNQPVFVIEEPGGELQHIAAGVTTGVAHADALVTASTNERATTPDGSVSFSSEATGDF